MPKKKYQKLWKKVQEVHSTSPSKSQNRYYQRLVAAVHRWSKKYGFDETDIQKIIIKKLGTKCKYCDRIITAKNKNSKLSLDHQLPKYRKGRDHIENIDIICSRCNTRKGKLTDKEYKKVLEFIDSLDKDAKKYLLQKLSSRNY